MYSKRIILEFDQAPNNKDLQVLFDLAKKLKAVVLQDKDTSAASDTKGWEPLTLGIAKVPADISSLAVKEADLTPLIEFFSDELSAEELCKML
jgi:hypothetical protein